MYTFSETILTITLGLILAVTYGHKDLRPIASELILSPQHHFRSIVSLWKHLATCQVSSSLIAGSLVVQIAMDL